MFSSSELSGCIKKDSEVYLRIRKYYKREEMDAYQSWRANQSGEDLTEYRMRRGRCPECGLLRFCECIAREPLSQMTLEDGIVPAGMSRSHFIGDPTTPSSVHDVVVIADLPHRPGAQAPSPEQSAHLFTTVVYDRGPIPLPSLESLEGATFFPAAGLQSVATVQGPSVVRPSHGGLMPVLPKKRKRGPPSELRTIECPMCQKRYATSTDLFSHQSAKKHL